MGKKIDELDKVISLMDKTNRLFVTGVIDLDTKTAILDTCKETVCEILKPVMPAMAQSDVGIQTTSPDPEEAVTEESVKGTFSADKSKKKRH